MRFFRSREDSLKFWLSFFFIAGSIAGSVFCNRMSPEAKTEFLHVEQRAITGMLAENVDCQRLFMSVLWKRLWEIFVLLLMFAVPLAEKLRLMTVACLGAAQALMISSLTMDVGTWGLWNYLCLCVPQGICYLLVGYLLLWWLPASGKRLTVGTICILVSILCLGVAVETYINPHFWTFLFKK